MKTLVWGAALLAAMAATCAASEQWSERRQSGAMGQFTYSWVTMPLLPRRFQNHCGYRDGRFICADYCGVDYQIYYCSRTVTGCCHIGLGYCDGTGKLRCSPALF
jgi:hypothetical protein